MRSERGGEAREALIVDIEVGAHLANDGCEAGVVHVTHLREQVVLDLVVETADVPRDQATARREVRLRLLREEEGACHADRYEM